MKERKMTKKGFKGTLEKQLKVYSAAAAGVLALAPSANAAIQYSGLQNLPVDSSHTPQNIDLNGDLSTEFIFNYKASGNTHKIFQSQSHGAQVIGAFSFGPVIRLSSNYQIKGTLVPGFSWYVHPILNLIRSSYGSYFFYGNFNNATGFMGVRFHTKACQGSDWNYGWIRYQGTTSPGSASGDIIDWAYEDSCNTPIAAGATRSQRTASVPTLNHWGMIIFTLLLGGLAARRLRKQENEDG
jgi:hypothetical protein